MDDDRLQLGIHDELRRAMGGFDMAADALLADTTYGRQIGRK